MYKGKQKCAGCGRTGEEYPRYDKDGLCLDCVEKIQLGRSFAEQLNREHSAIRIPELSNVHMTWYEIPFVQEKLRKFLESISVFPYEFASRYGKPPSDDFLLGTPGCGTSYDTFVVPTDSVEPLKEFCRAIKDKMNEIREKEDNMRSALEKEMDSERDRIYNDGVERGRDLLRQLNDGEIRINDFKARQKYEKPKN